MGMAMDICNASIHGWIQPVCIRGPYLYSCANRLCCAREGGATSWRIRFRNLALDGLRRRGPFFVFSFGQSSDEDFLTCSFR